MKNLKASVMLWRGELAEAYELADSALHGFRRIDDRFGQIQALGTVNRAAVALGRFVDAERTVEEIMVLSGSFGELAYPALAAAGTAMHLGRGNEALARAQEAVGRLDTTGANVDEGRVIGAFGRILVGDPEAAIETLLEVQVEHSPFALAARATAAAMLGDRDRACADADLVVSMGEVSYWDRSIALAAAFMVATADRDERRARLLASIDGVDDVMVNAYVERLLGHSAVSVHAQVGDDTSGPSSRIVDLGGWADVADRLAAQVAPS